MNECEPTTVKCVVAIQSQRGRKSFPKGHAGHTRHLLGPNRVTVFGPFDTDEAAACMLDLAARGDVQEAIVRDLREWSAEAEAEIGDSAVVRAVLVDAADRARAD
jgi:hypothetical protein